MDTIVVPTIETWSRNTDFNVCAIQEIGSHVSGNTPGYVAILARPPADAQESVLKIEYADGLVEHCASVTTHEGPVKWAYPTHIAFQPLPVNPSVSNEEVAARLKRVEQLIEELNPRFLR